MNSTQKAAAIVAITQIFKQYGVPSKFCPVIAIALGIIFEYVENPTAQGALNGLILGATVTGGYGVIKGSAQSILEPMKRRSESSYLDLEHDDDRLG
jgi:hypothetical protein